MFVPVFLPSPKPKTQEQKFKGILFLTDFITMSAVYANEENEQYRQHGVKVNIVICGIQKCKIYKTYSHNTLCEYRFYSYIQLF